MLPFFAISLVDQTTVVAPVATSFFARPIDVIFFDFFVWFGWIPIAITVVWGMIKMFQNTRQGRFVSGLKFVLLAIDVPAITEQTPKALENLFSNMYGAKSTLTWKEIWIIGKLNPVFSFEIVSTEGYLQFLVRTQTRFRDIIEAGIYAHYPDAEISEVEDYTQYFPSAFPDEEYDMWGGEFVLDKDEIYPIKTYVEFEDKMTGEIKDPLGNTLEQMAKMKPGEHFWIQILVQPSTNDWTKKSLKKLNELYGKKEKVKKNFIMSGLESALAWPIGLIAEITSLDLTGLFGAEEPEKEPHVFLPLQETKEAEAIHHKMTKVGLGTKIRILYVAKKNAFVKVERTGIVKGILNQYADLAFNKFTLFIPQVPKDDYFWMRWVYARKQRTLMAGYKSRSWGIGANPFFLNVEELASLWHFPAISIKAPLIKKAEARRAEPPVGLPITFLEQTLPGAPEEVELLGGKMEGAPTRPKSSAEALRDAIGSAEVPEVKPLTHSANKHEDFVPPNLPV
jgi:hypothetical protein